MPGSHIRITDVCSCKRTPGCLVGSSDARLGGGITKPSCSSPRWRRASAENCWITSHHEWGLELIPGFPKPGKTVALAWLWTLLDLVSPRLCLCLLSYQCTRAHTMRVSLLPRCCLVPVMRVCSARPGLEWCLGCQGDPFFQDSLQPTSSTFCSSGAFDLNVPITACEPVVSSYDMSCDPMVDWLAFPTDGSSFLGAPEWKQSVYIPFQYSFPFVPGTQACPKSQSVFLNLEQKW